MYHTYILDNNEGLQLITKAENKNDGLIKFEHYVNKNYSNERIFLSDIYKLNKTQIIDFC